MNLESHTFSPKKRETIFRMLLTANPNDARLQEVSDLAAKGKYEDADRLLQQMRIDLMATMTADELAVLFGRPVSKDETN